MSDEMVTHFDRCLGCMACVTACPSGVRYDRLIERVRPQVERRHRRTPAERALRKLLFETLPHPKRLRALAPLLTAGRRLGAERALPERLAAVAKVAPQAPVGRAAKAGVPELTPAMGARAGPRRVCCWAACSGSSIPASTAPPCTPSAPRASRSWLPRSRTAAAPWSSTAARRPRRAAAPAKTMAVFNAAQVDHVVVNAAGCGSAMKEYGDLLQTAEARAFSEKVRDVTELLASVTPRAPRGPVPLRVAYHDACHLAHAQGVRSAPRELLRAIPDLELVEVGTERDVCCGSAGIYNLVQPEAAAELGVRKARHLIDTGAQAIAAGNPGCAAQLDLYLRELGCPLPIHHPVELVSRSITAARIETGALDRCVLPRGRPWGC